MRIFRWAFGVFVLLTGLTETHAVPVRTAWGPQGESGRDQAGGQSGTHAFGVSAAAFTHESTIGDKGIEKLLHALHAADRKLTFLSM